MSSRKLRPEELELWKRVARTTDRLHPKMPEIDLKPENALMSPKSTEKSDVPRFKIGQKVNGKTSPQKSLPGVPNQDANSQVQMDRKAFDRLKRGKLKPQGTIDLHGMTLNQAQPALTAFIVSSFAKDRRLVLVITGKGKEKSDLGPIPERPGVLRRNVPHWLQTPPLAQMVLQVTHAHGRHGGDGAYYVYLRRRR